ncbi:MAG: hypothetical protein KGM24_08980 [Elusimicrobia bacterium]|nr:hypothetical protein [Elusimicrobiota bacterium]
MNLLAPQAVLAAGVVGALGLGLRRRSSGAAARVLALAAPLIALLALCRLLASGSTGAPLPPLIHLDLKGLYWQAAIYLGALPLAVLSSGDDVETALFLGATLGMGLLAAAATLPMLFVGLEFMSLPAYLLVARAGEGNARGRLEAAVKYFFAGAFAGAMFLLGMSLYYAATGSLAAVAGPIGPEAQAGLALMGAAALFKAGSVPLHWWLPDVYEASSPEVAGFLSTSMKAAAVLFLMRIVALAPQAEFASALPALGALTTLVGAILALRQKRLQRLLAYSSLAHAGLLILGVGAWAALGRGPQATLALLFYVVAYAFMSNGVFLFLKASGLETREQLRGYAARRPWLAAAFAVLLLSLGGIPPTGGFLAKFLVLWQAVRASLWGPALVAALAALASLGYYLGLVRDAYFEEPAGAAPAEGCKTAALVVGLCALGALLLGAAPLLMGGLGVWR